MGHPEFDSEFSPAMKHDFAEPPPLPEEPRKGRGCFFYGCLTVVILMVVGGVLVGIGTYVGYRYLQRSVEEYTSPAPMPPHEVVLSPEERKEVRKRSDEFTEAVKAGKEAEPLVLTADEINGLIEDQPDLRGKAFVRIVDDTIHVDLSLPLDQFGFPMLRGRYFNGNAEVKVSVVDGVPFVRFEAMRVKDRPVPKPMQDAINDGFQKSLKEPQNAENFRRLERVEVKDGKVLIRVKPKPEPAAGGAPKTEPAGDAAPKLELPKSKSDGPGA